MSNNSEEEVDKLFEAEKELYVIECMDCNQRGKSNERFGTIHRSQFPTHIRYMLSHISDLEGGQEYITC